MTASEACGDKCESPDLDVDRVSEVQNCMVDGLTATHMAQIFKALSDPTRVRIISALAHGEMCVYELAAALGMSQSAVSHQLRTMRDMRLVRYRREGRHVYYTLNDEHIRDLFHKGLAHAEHD